MLWHCTTSPSPKSFVAIWQWSVVQLTGRHTNKTNKLGVSRTQTSQQFVEVLLGCALGAVGILSVQKDSLSCHPNGACEPLTELLLLPVPLPIGGWPTVALSWKRL